MNYIHTELPYRTKLASAIMDSPAPPPRPTYTQQPARNFSGTSQFSSTATTTTPSAHNQYNMLASIVSGSDDSFSGTPMESPRRWLKLIMRKYGVDANGQEKAAKLILEEIDQRLRGEAAVWADTNPIIKKILSDEGLNTATQDTLAEFKEHFLTRFTAEAPTDIEPDELVERLKQGVDQSLTDYYHQTSEILKMFGVDDASSDDSKMAKSLLRMVVKKFVAGLEDPVLQARMAGYSLNTDCTLRGAYQKAQVELQKAQAQQELFERNKQQTELTLLREMRSCLVDGKNLPAHLLRQLQNVNGSSPSVNNLTHDFSQMNVAPAQNTFNQAPEVTAQAPPTAIAPNPTPAAIPSQPSVNVTVQAPRPQTNSRPPPVVDTTYDFSRSTNAIVRGEEEYRYMYNNPLCYRCGERGHNGRDCEGAQVLPRQERDFLLNLMAVSRERANAAREARQANTGTVATGANSTPLGTRTTESHFTEVQFVENELDDVDWEQVIPEMLPDTNNQVNVFNTSGEKRNAGHLSDPNTRAAKTTRTDGPTNAIEAGPSGQAGQSGGADPAHVIINIDANDGGKKKKKARKPASEPKPPPPAIRGKLNDVPIDIKSMLSNMKMAVPFLDLASVSPWFRDEVKRVLQVPRKPRQKKNKDKQQREDQIMADNNFVDSSNAVDVDVNTISDEVMDSIEAWKSKGKSSTLR